jgi:hypothetical protein
MSPFCIVVTVDIIMNVYLLLPGRSYCSLYTLDNIHRLFFVTRLIINTINKVQWVDFKLENVLVSLHSLKTMGLGSIIFKEWGKFVVIVNLEYTPVYK